MKTVRLLVTRKIDGKLAEEAIKKGIQLSEKEFISIQPILSALKAEELNNVLEKKYPLVFTSKYGVRNFAILIGKNNMEITSGIYCLEGATLDEVNVYFPIEDVKGTAENAAMLAQKIITTEPDENILFICGDRRRDELPELLTRNGKQVTEVVVYETQLAPVEVTEPFDAIAFFSPSAVESFFSMNTMPANIVCFSVGRTTTAEIKKYVNNKVITTARPSETQVMQAVFDHFDHHQPNN